jgi:Cdc6-like AAA superfamily ATPase
MYTFAKWFALTDGHQNFFIANEDNANLLFARQQLDSQLKQILRKSFRTSNPPKFVLYGAWGVGKTHTLNHIRYEISHTEGYHARVVYVELADINSRDTFQVAHSALLDSLGLSSVKSWMVQFQTRHQSEALAKIQTATQSEDIAKAFLNIAGYGDIARLSWDWLRGISLTAVDARNAGLPMVLSQSNHFVAVLRMLGRLSQEIDDQFLILMLDEATKLTSVTNGDAINHWLNAFKVLSDDLTKELGFIVAASFRDPDDMPQMLEDRQVSSRFGAKNYIQLQDFGDEETRVFLIGLLSEWVDPTARASNLNQYKTDADGEFTSDEYFPFTQPAFDVFVEYSLRDGNIATPRDIQKSLDFVLNRAIDDERHLVSSVYLNAMLAAG